MIKKGSKLYSIFKRKCPYCHEGDFFEGSFFKAKPKDHCPNCQKKYSKEPGFYQGSYYVVYALGVAVFVTIWCSMELFLGDVGFDQILYAVVGGLVLAAPFTYPLSKVIWANLFFHYTGERKKTTKQDDETAIG